MKFVDLTVTDISGATKQWADYMRGALGFDHNITCDVTVKARGAEVWLHAYDKFQEPTEYSRRIGQFSYLDTIKADEDWAAVCERAWEKLKRAMQRDERELRHGLSIMGGVIEHSEMFTSAVGKMLAERILAARDEASAHLIEFRQPQPAE